MAKESDIIIIYPSTISFRLKTRFKSIKPHLGIRSLKKELHKANSSIFQWVLSHNSNFYCADIDREIIFNKNHVKVEEIKSEKNIRIKQEQEEASKKASQKA